MSTVTKTLYETDFVEWADRTAELLRQGKLEEVDIEHLLEEVEGLSAGQRSAVSSQLGRMLKHLVKQQVQPERHGTSWIVSINNARSSLQYNLDGSPSLIHHLRAKRGDHLPPGSRRCLGRNSTQIVPEHPRHSREVPLVNR